LGSARRRFAPPASVKKTVPEWKAAIPELFRIVYDHDFREHPLLQDLKNSIRGSAKTAEGKPGRPGDVRELMLKRVKQAFGSIAALD